MIKRVPGILALCATVCALLSVGVANASAATLYVSNSAPAVAGGKTCVEPAYNTVQGAINAGGTTIDVCPGTYIEQLSIAKAVSLVAVNGTGTATVALPAGAEDSTSACDTKEGLEQIDEISICTAATVSVTGLNVQALIPIETCAKGLNGIFVGGGGTLKGTNFTVDGASTTLNALKGCQHGIAIDVGSIEPNEVGHAVLSKVTAIGYQKNGPTVSGAGSTLTMTSSTVTGEGPSPYIAQNGVQVAYGAKGIVKSSTISGNECDVASCGATGEQASGVLFYQAAQGSSVTTATVSENDLGVYYSSGSATVPATPEVTLSKDVLTSNRYEGVYLEEGDAALRTLTINGSGRVGIELNQYATQKAVMKSTASGMKVSGQSEASIKVTSDKLPGDIAGKFTFSGTAAAPVLINESSNFEVIF